MSEVPVNYKCNIIVSHVSVHFSSCLIALHKDIQDKL